MIINPLVLASFKSRMVNAMTVIGEVLDGLNDPTDAEEDEEEIFEISMIEDRSEE